MAYLLAALLLGLSWCAYRLGERAGAAGPRQRGILAVLCTTAILAVLVIDRFPEVEYRLLVIPGYAWMRGVLFLPFACALAGVARHALTERSRRAVGWFTILLATLAIYDMRWGVGPDVLGSLRGERDAAGLIRASVPETTGAAAAASLAYYYNVAIGEGDMAEASFARTNGRADAVELCAGLRSALSGSECAVRVQRLDWAALREVGNPCLLMLAPNTRGVRAVVAFVVEPDGIIAGHPTRGLVRIERENLEEGWTGVAVIVDPPVYLEPSGEPPRWVGPGPYMRSQSTS
jgi:hypothetical protein